VLAGHVNEHNRICRICISCQQHASSWYYASKGLDLAIS